MNALALSMWEHLDFSEIDASVLSRVLKGERLFTQKQLIIFCKLLSLDTKEITKLREALLLDLLKRFDLDEIFLNIHHEYFLQNLEKDLERIWEVRTLGQSVVGLNWSDFLLEQIKNKTSSSIEEPEYSIFLNLYVKALFQKCVLLCDITSPQKLLQASTPFINEIKSTGNILKNNSIINIANCRLASVFHIMGKSKPAISLASSGFLMDKNISVQALSQRESLINLGRLGNLKDYESLKKMASQNLKRYPKEYRFQFYEGLARAENDLGRLSKAIKYLELAEKTKDDTNILTSKYIYHVQLTSVKLHIQKKYPKTFSTDYLEKDATNSLLISKEHGYKRYENNLISLMQQIF
ncbi:hypothetical protein HYS03_02745 [Candidatus Woesebacteria bacterium]|nr:hypothetical protein [Candidatus Woesebacteria bacterium]